MGQALRLDRVSDDDLLRRLAKLISQSRRIEADLVAHIGEVDARRLYRREAAPSMFEYCRQILHLSEAEAYLRISVARLARRYPVLLDMLEDGRLHLSGIERLGPHLTARNRDRLLERATHKSKREIEEIVAELAPRPDVPPRMRKLPTRETPPSVNAEPHPGESPAAPAGLRLDGVSTAVPKARSDGASTATTEPLPDRASGVTAELRLDGVTTGHAESPADAVLSVQAPPVARPPKVEALGAARFKVTFTVSAELREKLERLETLMRSSKPDVDLAKVIEVAVTRELERVESKRFGKTKAPRRRVGQVQTASSSRHVPAPVRRLVHQRDGSRCTFRNRHGQRCTRRHDFEFHHKRPFAKGGAHSPENLALMCKAHNALVAEQDYGKEVMRRFARSDRQGSRPQGIAPV